MLLLPAVHAACRRQVFRTRLPAVPLGVLCKRTARCACPACLPRNALLQPLRRALPLRSRGAGAEAQALRLVSQTFESKEALAAGAAVLAASIAAKSPLAVVGTKRVLLHQRWVAGRRGASGARDAGVQRAAACCWRADVLRLAAGLVVKRTV